MPYPTRWPAVTMNVMSNDQNLKKQLPFPYDQDLSQVLSRLDRRTPFARDRLANDPVTAAYLAAAVRLVGHNLGPQPERILNDPRDATSSPARCSASYRCGRSPTRW